MKERCLLLIFCLVLSCGSLSAQANDNPGFERLKTLVGEWGGKSRTGATAQVSYRLVSANSAIVETLRPAGESEMITVYSRDGDQVALTHYCSAGNQPRMRTSSNEPGALELVFAFAGATNLPNPDVGHMHGLTLQFSDPDHLTQKWTWREAGKPDSIEVFELTRKK